jgi:hypothetical protein
VAIAAVLTTGVRESALLNLGTLLTFFLVNFAVI